ncbi:hypothetical protein DM02DRAFT_624077 [Periconia macrospinosa]|uniref:Uncharacterized protein n=1 Tax=Periconia macrospinosa TaxID=97972 RepID=A0A2V1E6N9_9PLEO|nr:hypothetical protein DM02DRAFT_624077 [Periconia macrospinosa]
MSNQSVEMARAIISKPHLTDELRIKILKHILKSLMVSNHFVTKASHQQWLDMFVEVAKFVGPSACKIAEEYYTTGVFELRVPSLFTGGEFVVPAFAHRVHNLKLVLPVETTDTTEEDDNSVGNSPMDFQWARGSILKYILRHQLPMEPQLQSVITLHNLHPHLALNRPGPAITTEWMDNFRSLETLEIVFERRGSHHPFDKDLDERFINGEHMHCLDTSMSMLLKWSLALPHYLEFPRHLQEVKVSYVEEPLKGGDCDCLQQFARVIRAIIARDFSDLGDLRADFNL